jgi:TetR/AcrR family transcriptional regulator
MVSARRAPEPDMRSAILAAATRLFAARGFDGTAIQDVASAVGVSKPAVLHHFPSKDALRAAVLEAMLAHWKETLPRLLLAATASEDRFQAVLGELRRFFAEDPDRARIVLREVLDRPDEMRRVLRSAVRPWLEAVARYIRAGQGSGRHHEGVDAEAYVVHVLELVIATAAAGDVTSAVLEGDRRGRYDREIVRIARTSLFTMGAPPPVTTGAARPARRKRAAQR